MKKSNPFLNRDLGARLRWPVLSWSSVSSFTYTDRNTTADDARDKWYRQYVLGEKLSDNPSMCAGRIIGERLANDSKYLPEVPRPEIYEHELVVRFGGITICGHMDGWSPKKKELLEYKTSVSASRWNKNSVDEHGQLDFYCLLLLLKHNIKPDDVKIRLVYIPVKMGGDFVVERSEESVRVFDTRRTTQDVLEFGVYLKKIYKEMQDYVIHRQKLA